MGADDSKELRPLPPPVPVQEIDKLDQQGQGPGIKSYILKAQMEEEIGRGVDKHLSMKIECKIHTPGCLRMADRIVYTNSTLPSVPCECCYSACLPPATAPSPRYYHVLYKQHPQAQKAWHGETYCLAGGHPQAQKAWHGETYCLVGGYRLYGDAPLATPPKAGEQKPAPRRALKRKTFEEEPDQDLGCPLVKIPRLTIICDDKWAQNRGDPSTLLASQAKAEAPRRASKRKTVHEDSEQDLGCPRAKIPRLKINHGGKWDHCLGCPCVPLATYAKAEEEKPAPRRALKRKRVQEESDIDLGCPRAKKPRLKIKRARKRGFQPSEINASILMKYMTTIGFTSVKAQTSTQKLACLIGVEGGHSLDNSLSVLRSFYQLETRYPMLTQICNTPCSVKGLSRFAEKVVAEMNQVGMVFDLCHVSDATARGALEVSQAPVIFSHSAARDDFEHIRAVPGSAFIGIGGDLMAPHNQDPHLGTLCKFLSLRFPQGLEDVSTYPVLTEELLRQGWNEQELERVLRGNLLQVFRHMEQVQGKKDGKVLWRKSFQRTSWTMLVTQSCHIETSETVSG
ncbi:hypothetical protein STEG23_018027 [Scotinomys teguina]